MKKQNEKMSEEAEELAENLLGSFEQGLNPLISSAEKLINPVTVEDDRQEILTFLFIKGLRTLKAIDLLCSSNLYSEALILVRSLIELTARFVQIATNEEELKRYIAFIPVAQYREMKIFHKAAPDNPDLISNQVEWLESRKKDYEKLKGIFKKMGWSKDDMHEACKNYGLLRLFPMYKSFCNPIHSNALVYEKYVRKDGNKIFEADNLQRDKFLAYSVSSEAFLIILKYFSDYLKIELEDTLKIQISEIEHLYEALQMKNY